MNTTPIARHLRDAALLLLDAAAAARNNKIPQVTTKITRADQHLTAILTHLDPNWPEPDETPPPPAQT